MKSLEIPVFESFMNHIPADNFVFSVLKEDTTVYNQFILNYYLDFYAIYNEENAYMNYRFADTCLWNKFKELSHIFVSRESIHMIETKNIISMLEAGYVILCSIDTSFVKAYRFNDGETINHMSHEIMIYGFDLEKKGFLCKDYFNYEYGKRTIEFSDIINAIHHYNLTDYKKNDTGLAAIKIWRDFQGREISFDRIQFKETIENAANNRLNTFLKTQEYLKRFPKTFDLPSSRIFFNFISVNICLYEKRAAVLQELKLINTATFDKIMELSIAVNKIMIYNRNLLLKAEVREQLLGKGNNGINIPKIISDLTDTQNMFDEIIRFTVAAM